MTLRLLVTLYDIITASDVLLWIEGVGSSELNRDETSVCLLGLRRGLSGKRELQTHAVTMFSTASFTDGNLDRRQRQKAEQQQPRNSE